MLPAIALLALLAPSPATEPPNPSCPPGKVWSGTRCEWQDLCNGKPWKAGDPCAVEEKAVPVAAPPPAPKEPVTPPPAPPPPRPVPLPRQPPRPECQGLFPAPPASPQAPAGSPDVVRRVLLVGGEAPALFEQYLSALKGQSLRRDLDLLTVTYFEKGKQVDLTVKKGFAEIIRGDTIEMVWANRLHGHVAERVAGVKAAAQELHADLMCGNQ